LTYNSATIADISTKIGILIAMKRVKLFSRQE